MKKLLPWFLGMILGILVAMTFIGILALNRLDNQRIDDPTYRLVAVSWGHSMNQSDNWLYQVQVLSTLPDVNGTVEISGRVCIGGGDYWHNMGTVGTATNMGEATKKYGSITWLDDRITIGGSEGVKASLLRSALEKHR